MNGKETEIITQSTDKFKQRNVASMNVLILISIWTEPISYEVEKIEETNWFQPSF